MIDNLSTLYNYVIFRENFKIKIFTDIMRVST